MEPRFPASRFIWIFAWLSNLMMRRVSPLVVLAVFVVAITGESLARKSATTIAPAPVSTHAAPGRSKSLGSAVKSAGVLQLWTFDNGPFPDPQGWGSLDRTNQEPYFHVDLGLFGSRAMWCGVSPCTIGEVCAYATLPGYGNDWKQRLQSIPFNFDGNDVLINFELHYDTESSYDLLYLEYASNDNIWHALSSWSGVGTESANITMAPGTYASPVRLRFRFESDGYNSDEDGLYDSNGAVFIDDIRIENNGVLVDSQFFELEPIGMTGTLDGHWQALGPVAFGDYAGLVNGNAVLQEDPGYFNSTHMWCFFNGSSETATDCGVDPGQLIVPRGSLVEGIDHYIRNEIESPVVSLTGLGPTEPVMLTFDAYMDLPRDNLVFYEYRVRSLVAGDWKRWIQHYVVYDDPSKVWSTRSHNLRPLIAAGATDIQIGLGVIDMCPEWCGTAGSGACHSHGPLFDNIRVTGANTATGDFVIILPIDPTTGATPVRITFDHVSQPGLTTVVTGPTGPTVPGSFLIGNSTYYNISTSATTTGNIELCIAYDEASLTVPENALRVLHWDTELNPDAWADVTLALDTAGNQVYATTEHLSPFVIGAGSVTDVGGMGTPSSPALHQNVPNPFNPTTIISYDVPPGGASVSIRIYDAAGRLVRTLVDEHRPAGTHSVTWDGRNAAGVLTSSGVYFYRMVSGSFDEARRMVLLK